MRAVLSMSLLAILAQGACAPSAPPSWIVEHEGKRSTLVGTMHAEVDVDALAPEIFVELRDARVLLTEADVRASALSNAELMAAVTLPDNQSLEELLSADDLQRVTEATSAFDPRLVARLQPWFLEGQIVVAGLPAVEPVDAGLVARAEADEVPLAFFETWQAQVEALNGLGVDDGIGVLLETARDPDAAVAAHLQWADAYVAGDVDEMTALAFAPAAIEARPAFYEDIVFRHEAWLARVEDEVREGNAVIAVGFMHMLTPRGIAAALGARGYTVTER